jgi:MscS family membrane protein
VIQKSNNSISDDLLSAIKNVKALESVINSFTAALLKNELALYRTARIADSKFFSILNTINQSPYSDVVNTYLAPLQLDAAKVIVVLLIIILIIVVIKILGYIVDYFLHRYALKDDDIRYIHAHITTLFKILASLMILHLILIAFIGIDIVSLNISKIFAIVYVLLFSLLWYRIVNTIAYLKIERMKKSKILKNEVINLSLKVIHGVNILITFIIVLKILGVNLTALLSGLGIAGAAVAFAAKDSIANIFGSIAILAGDVFEQGDWIETKDVNGTVVEIGLRASTIRTFDNALISIPNFELSNSGVKNWSRRRIGRRIKMTLSLTYESDFKHIKQAILEIREMLKNHQGIANQSTEYRDEYRQSKLVSTEDYQGVKRTSLVYMDTFSDSSIDILVYCFSRTVAWDEWLAVKEDVMFKIADILKKNHLEFAYPTLTLHQVKEDEVG